MSHWLLDQDKFQQILASLRVPALRVDGRPGGGSRQIRPTGPGRGLGTPILQACVAFLL